jgi:uroporphyrinogen-III synthase
VKILVTRPEPEAQATVDRLAGRGFEAIAAPVLRIRPVPDAPIPLDCAALLVTSANAVRALEGRPETGRLLAKPVFAVGDRTAEVARGAGFSDVRSAAGDVGDLERMIVSAVGPNAGRLVHLSGRETAGDLQGRLAAAGFDAERIVVYEAVAAPDLPADAVRLLKEGEVKAVLLYSPRSASLFGRLAAAAGAPVAAAAAVVLSDKVAEAARAAGFARIAVAARPDEGALFDALEQFVKPAGQD